VWTAEGSPLLKITERQAAGVARGLERFGAGAANGVETVFGMRYGSPSLESRLDLLAERGCSKILLFPMYPQYAAPTTGSTCDAVFAHILKRRWVPTLRVAEPYYRHPAYLRAVAARINETIAADGRPDRLLLSFHGMPKTYLEKGDPYCCMCTETSAALRPLISMPGKDIIQTYQSRFGSEPWLTPFTDDTIRESAKSGVKHLAVALPGFAADCLETIDEIGVEGKKLFLEHGGQTFSLIPCVNDHPTWIGGMCEIIAAEIGSWAETARSLAARSGSCDACPAHIVPQSAGNE
jgi:ferrochelatase